MGLDAAVTTGPSLAESSATLTWSHSGALLRFRRYETLSINFSTSGTASMDAGLAKRIAARLSAQLQRIAGWRPTVSIEPNLEIAGAAVPGLQPSLRATADYSLGTLAMKARVNLQVSAYLRSDRSPEARASFAVQFFPDL